MRFDEGSEAAGGRFGGGATRGVREYFDCAVWNLFIAGKARVERAKEYLLLVKSTRKRFAALRREIERLHSYDVPEIIALPIAEGSAGYLRWLGESVQPKPR